MGPIRTKRSKNVKIPPISAPVIAPRAMP